MGDHDLLSRRAVFGVGLDGNLVDQIILNGIPGHHFPFVFTDEALDENREVSERVVSRDISELIALAQLQQEVEELSAKFKALFISISVLIN